MTSQANITVKMQLLFDLFDFETQRLTDFGARPLICNSASKKKQIHDRGDTSKNNSTFFAKRADRKTRCPHQLFFSQEILGDISDISFVNSANF